MLSFYQAGQTRAEKQMQQIDCQIHQKDAKLGQVRTQLQQKTARLNCVQQSLQVLTVTVEPMTVDSLS